MRYRNNTTTCQKRRLSTKVPYWKMSICTIDIVLPVALENGSLVIIATTVLQDTFNSDKSHTALRTALMENKSTMLPISNFI